MPLESSNVVAQAESWQVQVLVNANCSPLTASALNDNETVVGRCRLPNNSLSAYRWTNGVLTVLPTTTAHSDAFAVNNSGQVVGELVLRWPGSPRAFVWSADGVVTVRQTGDGRRDTGDGRRE